MLQVLRLPLVVLLAGIVFLAGLGDKDITGSHEARVAQTAREMADAGWPWSAQPVPVPGVELVQTPDGLRLLSRPDIPKLLVNPWLVPVLNGQLRLQKPPLPYWCTALLYRAIGQSELAARLIPASLGVLCALLIYDLARRLVSRSAGWIASLLWLSSWFIVGEFRKSMADPYLAFCTLGAFWCYVRGGSGSRSVAWILASYTFAALGLLAKGPVILLHLALAVVALHVCRRCPLPGRWYAHLLGIVVALSMVLPWPAYVLARVPHVLALWQYESIGEVTGQNVENARPWYFYVCDLPRLSHPWFVFWLLALAMPALGMSRLRSGRRIFPLMWYAGTVLAFSIMPVKKAAYLLPAMPAQVLMMTQAASFLMILLRRSDRMGRTLAEAQKWCIAAWAFVLAVMLSVAWESWPADGQSLKEWLHLAGQGLARFNVGTASLVVLVLGAGLLPLVLNPVQRPRLWLATSAVCGSVLVLVSLAGLVGPRDNGISPRTFAREVAAAAALPDRTLYRQNLPEQVLFYLPGGLRYDPSARSVLIVLAQRPTEDSPEIDLSRLSSVLPGVTPLAVRPVPVSSASGRNPWRLYEVNVRPGRATVEDSQDLRPHSSPALRDTR